MANIVIEGIEVSEETAALALREYLKGQPKKPYQFQAGDVCKSENDGMVRIIMAYCGDLLSFNDDGTWTSSNCQRHFESARYRKIGELKDYIK